MGFSKLTSRISIYKTHEMSLASALITHLVCMSKSFLYIMGHFQKGHSQTTLTGDYGNFRPRLSDLLLKIVEKFELPLFCQH